MTVPRARDGWVVLALVVVTGALYWPVHGYDFVHLDDVEYVRQNAPVVAGLTPASVRWAFSTMYEGFWIPLTWLSFMLDTQVHGPGPTGYHVTNVVLHVANTVLVFALLRAATGRRWASAFVALCFAVHPLHVESVAWVTERKDVLSTLFLLLTLWAYGRWVARPGAWRYAVTLVVFVLGLMAKPMLTTLPFLLLLLDLWPLRRFAGLPPLRIVAEKVPFLVLAGVSTVLTMMAGGHLPGAAPLAGVAVGARVGSAIEAYVHYVVATVWPTGLAPIYPDPGPPPVWRATLAALGLLVATAGALRLASRRPWVTVGWLWFGLALLPVIGLVRIGPFVVADRFTYVPLLGLFVIVAWEAGAVATDRRRRAVVVASAALVSAAALVAARVQLGYWRDSFTLFERTLAVTGDNPAAQYLLGLALAERGRVDEAEARYAEALRLSPGYAHVHTTVGLLRFERGDVDGAIDHYEAALRSDPGDVYAHANLGNALRSRGRDDEAIAHYREALRIAPYLAETEANLAGALAERGDLDEAIAHYGASLRLRPAHAGTHAGLAGALAARGRFAEAVEHYETALRLGPDDARLRGDLGNALAAAGRLDAAVAQYEAALRVDPTSASAHNNLANALVLLGRADEGIAQYAEALRLDPAYAEAHVNLGVVLAGQGRTAEARAHFREALRIRPAYAAAHTQLGLALVAEGRRDDAAREFGEALRLDPGDVVARRELDAPARPE